jgi:hypothetical protein
MKNYMRATFEVLTAVMTKLPGLMGRHRVNRQMVRSTAALDEPVCFHLQGLTAQNTSLFWQRR